MKHIKFLLCFFLLFASMICFSQSFTFSGYTQFDEEPLADAKIKVMQGSKAYSETTSDSKGFFSLKLDFNLDYTVYFEKTNCAVMYASIAGAVPEDKAHYKIKYGITVPFYDTRNETVNLKAFEKPFTRIAFDGKAKFVDDPAYIKEFMIILQTLPEQKPVVKITPIQERKYRIAGKVLRDDTARSPYRLIKISLIDTNNKELGSTLTNRFGVFSFPSAGIKSSAKLVVTTPAEEKGKAVIYSMNKEKLTAPGTFSTGKTEFSNTVENKLIERLISDNYVPFIAGKFSVEENGESVLLSGKSVYLMSDKNEVLETTKTNVFGNFLFSKLSPDRNFTIGVDETDPALNAKRRLHLYSSKDVEILIKDTLLDGKHLYKFLSNDVKSYNELVVEDSDIRMDLKGKMVGDNENNPLKNMRIVLLDNSYKVIDSITTDKNGKFNFRYLPYTNDLVLQIRDTASLLNYTSIILYDEKGNVVKYISIRNGKQFKYKLLHSDLNQIDELYMDDPWLNLTDKDFKKPVADKMVIIENIYFEFNKVELLVAAKQTLDKAILAMQSNPAMKIDISAHSDSKGSDDYNLKLSEQRAQRALDYIVAKGIDKTRVLAKGYGESKLLNKCDNKTECSEEAHAKNRRLEFNISMK
jgi:outer membrane protein OmpA-like peptidoglycan-associated protein